MLYVVGYWLPYFDLGFYNYEWQVLLMRDGDGRIVGNEWWLQLSVFVITMIISVMLFFLVPIARRAYLFLIIALTASNLLWGLRITTPIENVIWGLVAMSDGAILTMLYFTSVANHFGPSAAQQGVPADRSRPAGEPGG